MYNKNPVGFLFLLMDKGKPRKLPRIKILYKKYHIRSITKDFIRKLIDAF